MFPPSLSVVTKQQFAEIILVTDSPSILTRFTSHEAAQRAKGMAAGDLPDARLA